MFTGFFCRRRVLPLLSNVMVVEGTVEMGLKGVGNMVSLKAGAAEIGSSMLGLDGIESMENVKQIVSQMQGKMDAGFQRLELLIKNRCGGGGPRPPQSGFSGGGLRPP